MQKRRKSANCKAQISAMCGVNDEAHARSFSVFRTPLSSHVILPYCPLKPWHTSVLAFFSTSYFRTVFFVLGILSFCKQDPSRFLVPVQVPRAYFLTLFEGRVVQPYRCQPPLHPHVDLLFFGGGGGLMRGGTARSMH